MRVLIVDDDIATVDAVAEQIAWEALGIEEVYRAFSITDAKTILSQNVPEIVVSDIEMPRGSGIELLEWYRSKKMEGKFLFLTSHDDFAYAAGAIKLQASDYILKPINITVLTEALKKAVNELGEVIRAKEEKELGEFFRSNLNQTLLNYWNRIFLTGNSYYEREENSGKQKNNLYMDPHAQYTIVVSRMTNVESDRQKMSEDLLRFILENIHSEFFCGTPENQSVLCYDRDTYLEIISCTTYCRKECLKIAKEELYPKLKELFSSDLTICIGSPVLVDEVHQQIQKLERLIEKNVMCYDRVFTDEMSVPNVEKGEILSYQGIKETFARGGKLAVLQMIKTVTGEKKRQNALTSDILARISEELVQAVVAYFSSREIDMTGFFESNYRVLRERASRSETDLFRWVTAFLDATVEFERRSVENRTLEGKIRAYIKDHVSENISRADLAEEFGLSPDYISKMYKKNTGHSLKEDMTEIKMEQAKILLTRGMRVSEVAEELGFDNATYFSTLFRETVGMTANQYRQEHMKF